MITFKHSHISLNRLRFHACHGVMQQERMTGGEFTVSVRARCSIEKTMESDDVCDTISYADMFDIIKREMLVPSALLEHVAGRIGKSILNELPAVESVTVTVEKMNPPMGADIDSASVELCLTRG